MPPNVIAVAAGTIHQESGWNPLAQSAFAKGLTQFTDPTWADMRRLDPSIDADIFNPHAAIRAMAVYHRQLYNKFTSTPDRWAFVLSAYNGGIGWVFKDQRLCATLPPTSCSPSLWWNNVELKNSGRAPKMFQENRGYPRNILKRWVPLYLQF